MIPREGVESDESKRIVICAGRQVIPREGVESYQKRLADRNDAVHVIPREGVESLGAFINAGDRTLFGAK